MTDDISNKKVKSGDIDLLEILRAIKAGKKIVYKSLIVSFILGIIISYGTPNVYKSEVTLLVENESKHASLLNPEELARRSTVSMVGRDRLEQVCGDGFHAGGPARFLRREGARRRQRFGEHRELAQFGDEPRPLPACLGVDAVRQGFVEPFGLQSRVGLQVGKRVAKMPHARMEFEDAAHGRSPA